jgi:hypothetical protein
VRFVANDLGGSVTIFECILFRFFPTINPIKNACYKVVKYDEIVEIASHVDVSRIGYRVVLV